MDFLTFQKETKSIQDPEREKLSWKGNKSFSQDTNGNFFIKAMANLYKAHKNWIERFFNICILYLFVFIKQVF